MSKKKNQATIILPLRVKTFEILVNLSLDPSVSWQVFVLSYFIFKLRLRVLNYVTI